MTKIGSVTAICAALGMTACATSNDRGIAFHERNQVAFAFGVTTGTTPEPVELSLAYKREVFAIVPRKGPGQEAQSLISIFQTGYSSESAAGNNSRSQPREFNILNAFATGAAAAVISKSPTATANLTSSTRVSSSEFQSRMERFDGCRDTLLQRHSEGDVTDATLLDSANQLGRANGQSAPPPQIYLRDLNLQRADFTDAQLQSALCDAVPAGD